MNILFIKPSVNNVTKASFNVLSYFKKYHKANVDIVEFDSEGNAMFSSETTAYLNCSFKFRSTPPINNDGEAIAKKIDAKFPGLIKRILLIDRNFGRCQFINEIIYVGSEGIATPNENLLTPSLMGYMAFADRVYSQKKYDFIFGCSGNYKTDIFSVLSDFYSIPFWEVFFSRIYGDKSQLRYLTNNYLKINFLFTKQRYDSTLISETSRAFLTSIRKERSKNYLISYQPKWKNVLRNLIKDAYWIFKYRHRSKFYFQRFLARIKYLLFYKHQKNILSNITTSSFSFQNESKSILVALSQLPELVLLSWAEKYISQVDYINKIFYHLPIDWFLNLREHPHNIGFRPNSFLKWIRSLRNIRMVSVDESQYVQIKNSDACITTTGTIGWESLVLKKPVFTFAPTFYDLTGLNYMLPDYKELNKIDSLIENFRKISENSEQYDDKLLKLITLEEETCFDINNSSTLKSIVDQMLLCKFTPFWSGK